MGFFDYEVALEILGQSKQPLVSAISNERKKEKPNQKLIDFLKRKKAAIDHLMEELDPEDEDLIKLILNPEVTVLRK
ncbi:TPA: hypothetical protein ACU8BU_001945 [Neisseria subflava]|jgi:hypothetical protein